MCRSGFKGRVLSLVSVYGPVSGAGFDDKERRDMFESLSNLLGQQLTVSFLFGRYGL